MRLLRRGMVLPTAVFMCMLSFLLCSVMVWQARDNLRFTRLESENNQHIAMAKAAANELVAGMMEDDTLEAQHPEATPLITEHNGVVLKA